MLNLPLLAHRRARDDIIDMYKHFHSFDKVIKKKTQTSHQMAFTCSKLTLETLEQGVKYVQSYI